VSGVGDMQLDAAVDVVGDLANAFATAVRCGDPSGVAQRP
jgi:hypothetical protein